MFADHTLCLHRRGICTQNESSRTLNAVEVVKLVRKLVTALCRLSRSQLRLLLQFGFCLSESPVTDFSNRAPGAKRHPSFGVCHGHTGPDNTYISHHYPSAAEIEHNLLMLREIFDTLPEPRMITLSRSFRDGYVPKHHAAKIEKGVVKTLQRSFPHFKGVWYDSNLLGGPDGWSHRVSKGDT